MIDYTMNKTNRILVALSGMALIIVLFVPLWQIDLIAPQYPEGLVLLIYPNQLGGNVDIINGLNHYIGMKTLHTKDFFEFKILPYCIVFFVIAFLTTAILGKKRWLNLLFILFVCFGIIAMIDFWRWEYNYGHNLDPNAAIIVPGMVYQPPLIGYKQLLNFAAYSMPNVGGWIFIGAGLILLFCVIKENKKKKMVSPIVSIIFITLVMSSCNTNPEPFVVGKDNCSYCKMTISDARFGVEIVTNKGKIFKYDDVKCMLESIEHDKKIKENIKDIYTANYLSPIELINVKEAFFAHSIEYRSPMGGNIAAFKNEETLTKINTEMQGSVIKWEMLYK
ncbi:MAG: nitrous oxide reductase accessory protein NosL [Chitinophagaceae bacterium]|nr:nitrous oxide reductase accessory protein NosL [Chitinophagaceae bacterium]